MANARNHASKIIGRTIAVTLSGVKREVSQRAYRASNELRSAELYILRGERSGRMYRIPDTGQRYRASAPGEAPALRKGTFRNSWDTNVRVQRSGSALLAVSSIENRIRAGRHPLGELLENGTRRMGARPYKQKIIDRAMPNIKKLYRAPYKGR